MKRRLLIVLVIFLAACGFAHAAGQELRTCNFDLMRGCRSGEARVTLSDSKLTGLDVVVIWCGRGGHRNSLDFTCTINATRGDEESVWSDDAGATMITDKSPYTDPTKPDRIKVTVGRDLTIDLNETQSLWRCGAGAELPLAIVIPAQTRICQVRFRPQ